MERLEARQLLATITWDGGPSGAGTDWADPVNWVGDVLPTALDDALINAFAGPAIQINGAVGVRSVNSAKSLSIVGSLTVSDASVFAAPVVLSGTLAGGGDCTFTSTLSWTGGVMAGPATTGAPVGRVVIHGAGTLNISGTTHDLNRVIENNGTAVWTGGAIRMAGGTFNNNNQFTASTAGSGGAGLQSFGSAGINAFNNVGVFSKLGPGEVSFSVLAAGVAFNSLGTIQLNEGLLTLAGGGTMSTPLTVNPGAAFTLGETYTFTGNGSINGSGVVNFTGGTHSLPAGRFNPTGPVNFTGGTITISTPFTPAALGPIGAAVTFQAVLNWSGDLTITGSASFAVAQTFSNLTLSGTLMGAGDITIPGAISWTSGTMSGTGKTHALASGSISLSSTGAKILSRTLNSFGAATWTGGDFGFAAGTFNNNGTFTANSDSTLLAYGNSGTNAFVSNGTFAKLGTGETRFTTNVSGAAFNNIGTVTVTAGQLTLGGGGSASAAFNVASGAVLSLAGNYTFSASGSIAGSGEVRFAGGTINIPAGLFNPTGAVSFAGGTVTINNAFTPASLAPISGTVTFAQPLAYGGSITVTGSVSFSQAQTFTNLTLAGTLSGAGDVTVTGTLTWVSGTMSGTGRTLIPTGAALAITSGATHTLSRQIVNTGSAVWSGGGIAMAGGTLTNNGTFLADAQTTLQAFGSGGTNSFVNTGLWTKQGSADALFFGAPAAMPFVNTGLVTVAQGSLALSGGSTTTQLTVQPGAALTFTGTFTHNPGGGLTGGGTINFNGGTHVLAAGQYAATGPLNINGGTVTINSSFTTTGLGPVAGILNINANVTLASLTLSGTLGGSGEVTVTGAASWMGGTLSGSGRLVIPVAGSLTISTGAHTLSKRIDASGAVSWIGGDIAFATGSLNILTGATLVMNSNAALVATGTGSGNAVSNAGTLTKMGLGEAQFAAGAGAVSLTNTGTASVLEGTLTIGGGGTTSGAWSAALGSTLRLSADYAYAGGSIAGAGTVHFTGGTHTLGSTQFNATGTVNFTGGTISIGNSFTPLALGEISASVTFGGSLNYNGAVTVSGSASFSTAQTFAGLVLSGTLSGAGTVTVTGALTWSGGAMTGTGQTWAMGTLSISGGAHTLSRVLDISGAAMWTDGGVAFAGGTMIVRAGAVLTVNAATALSATGTTAANAMNIQGSLVKAGIGALKLVAGELGVDLNLTGSVAVQEGTLELAGGGTVAGAIDVQAAGTLSLGADTTYTSGTIAGAGVVAFTGGTHVLIAVAFNPTGTVQFSGGTVTIDDAFTPAALGTIGGTVKFGAALGWTGAVTVTGSASFAGAQTFGDLTVSGTLTGAGNITVMHGLVWTGGSMIGTGRTIVPQGGTLTLSGGAHTLGRQLDMAGTGMWTSGDLIMTGGTWSTTAGGVLTVDAAGAVNITGPSGTNVFNNVGTLTKRGTGTLAFGAPVSPAPGVFFNNAGVTSIEAGGLLLGAGGTTPGGLAVAAGASLTLAASLDYVNSGPITGGGTVNFVGGAHLIPGNQLAVTGAVNFTGGTITVSGSFAPASLGPIGASVTFQSSLGYSGALTITGTATFNGVQSFSTLNLSGTLSGAGQVTVGGALNWTGGSMSGSGRTLIAPGATLSLSGSAKNLSRGVYLSGTATWTAGDLAFNGGLLQIESTGIMTVSTTGTLSAVGASGENGFILVGTLNKTGTGALSFPSPGTGIEFSNYGTLYLQSGTVNLGFVTNYSSNTLTGGTWFVDNLAYLVFPTGTAIYTNNATVRLRGIDANFVAFNALCTNVGSVTLENGRLWTFSPLGNLFTNSGTFIKTGSGSVPVPAAITFNNVGTLSVLGGSMTLSGPVSQVSGTTLTGGSWSAANGGQLNIAGAAIQTSHAAIYIHGATSAFGAIAGMRTNMGSLTIAGGKTLSPPAFTNLGKLTIGPGSTLTVAGTFDNTLYAMNHGGSIVASGGGNSMGPFWFFQGGSISLGGTHAFGAGATLIGAGSLSVTGGSASFAGDVNLQGTLNVSGGVAAFNTDTYFTSAINTGTLSLGTSRLSLTGVYTQGTNGVLSIRMDSDNQFGRIVAGGAVTLAGRINVTWGYTPAVGVVFNFINGASRVGVFNTVSLGALDGRAAQLQYEPGGVSLIIQPA